MDSRYVLNAIQKKWLRGWRRRGWKKADGSKLQNKQLWQQIDANLREFPRIQYFWTKGHADDKGNVYVDHLLNKRMDKMAKKSPQSAETPQPAHHKPAEKPQRIEDKPKISQTKTSQPKLAPRTSHSVSDIEKVSDNLDYLTMTRINDAYDLLSDNDGQLLYSRNHRIIEPVLEP